MTEKPLQKHEGLGLSRSGAMQTKQVYSPFLGACCRLKTDNDLDVIMNDVVGVSSSLAMPSVLLTRNFPFTCRRFLL